jgi:glycosyltransferase involved in cell wall biosynthesis
VTPMPGNILALTRYDRLGASSRVRVLQYLPYLESKGIKVDAHPLFTAEDLRRLYKESRRPLGRLAAALSKRISTILRNQSSDVLWLQQELFPFLPFGIEAALLGTRRLVIDFDDAHHLYYKDTPAPFGFLYRNKIERLMQRADIVVVGSPMMADVARQAGAKDVRLVHSAVDTSSFPASVPDSEPFTVGWIGTPMTAMQSFHLIREPLARFLAETNARGLFIGMDADQFPDLPGDRLPWSEATEHDALPRVSVGLCPLDDSPWTRGKSGYKIIQYMAAGRPTLTSPVGIAADLVEDGTTGFHCRTAGDWYRRLHQLHGSAPLLRDQGAAARKRAAERYDLSLAAVQMAAVFEDCLRG